MKTGDFFVATACFIMAYPVMLVAHIAKGFWRGITYFWTEHLDWIRFATRGD